MPSFAEADHIVADAGRVELAAQVLCSGMLRIATEPGPVSRREHGADLRGSNWGPALGNVIGSDRDVPVVRTVVGDTESFPGRNTDWVVVNTGEMLDRMLERSFIPRQLGRWSVDITTPAEDPMHDQWVDALGDALKAGIRSVARQKITPRHPSSLPGAARTYGLTGGEPLVHSHKPIPVLLFPFPMAIEFGPPDETEQ